MLLLSQSSAGLIENLYKAETFIQSIGSDSADIVTLFYDLLGEQIRTGILFSQAIKQGITANPNGNFIFASD